MNSSVLVIRVLYLASAVALIKLLFLSLCEEEIDLLIVLIDFACLIAFQILLV